MSQEIVHTQRCLEGQQRAKDFEAKYPNFCRMCGATGSWSTPSSRLDPPDGGPCAVCVEQGKCPLCAGPVTWVESVKDGDYGKCLTCGWNELGVISGLQTAITYPEPE